MQNYYSFIVQRLNGDKIRSDFRRHRSLVRKGIAGFIVFGGELEEVREYVKRLQEEAELPLIIASDLERGLGQQIRGGTLFPPAMAIASAFRTYTATVCRGAACRAHSPALRRAQQACLPDRQAAPLRKTFRAIALEAAYAGINTILAPVLDINTNPKNPIIAARAFGEDRETVSFFGCEMIKTLQRSGIAACGKHFPGHGDTETDSHISLPAINRGLQGLKRDELYPFKQAIEAGVKMIMLGHLKVPALDPSGIPVSLSKKAVSFLRKSMDYSGILITDAMNMGGIGKFSEEEASFMALSAGVDVILHPTDPGRIVFYLAGKNISFSKDRLERFRRGLIRCPSESPPDFGKNSRLAEKLAEMAITVSGSFRIKGRPFLIVLNDEDEEKGGVLSERLAAGLKGLDRRTITRKTGGRRISIPENSFVIVALFSETKAWKGGAGRWLYRRMEDLKDRADLFISFGSPYLLDAIKGPAKMLAYSDSESAQEAAAKKVLIGL